MRAAGRFAAEVLEMITPYVKAGISTGEIDSICHNYIVNVQKNIPAPLYYPSYDKNDPSAFPKSICTSVNEVVCHGIPSNNKILKDGDIVNIDVTVIHDGYHGDTSKMFHIGEPTQHNQKLVEVTQQCLYEAINMVKPGVQLGDIGARIQSIAEAQHYSVVREYCGHGIGKVFHEEPQVLHYGKPKTGLILKAGMTFTIEPMINLGSRETKLNKKDGWTVTTKDRRSSAQWEHTIGVTETGCEVFTARKDEPYYKA
jgi:methionyl aminopeptidase